MKSEKGLSRNHTLLIKSGVSSGPLTCLWLSDAFDVVKADGVGDRAGDGGLNDLRKDLADGLANVLVDASLDVLVRVLLRKL